MSNATFAARLWAALGEEPMPNRRSSRIITCAACGQTRPHEGRGLCVACYNRARRTERPALPVPPTPRPDPASRLPIPPMVRCAGAPGIPCDRQARADVGRCWRCQQEMARAGVAA